MPPAADRLPILSCACASLRRAARAVTRSYEAALKESGLQPTQFTLLQALEVMGQSSQRALADLLALDSTTLTRSLSPLEKRGWIRSGPGRDRREVRWSLTPAGRRLLAAALPAWERAQAHLRARLGASRWERLAADLAVVGATQ
jgi:DNA-binding MarR family transcriptional regulator